MFSLRISVQCFALALCAIAAGASWNKLHAQSGGAMGMSDSAHAGKMKPMHDSGAMSRMGTKDKMGGMAKPHSAMSGKMDAKHSNMGPDKMKSSAMHGDSAMKRESNGMKKTKARRSMAKDSTKKMR